MSKDHYIGIIIILTIIGIALFGGIKISNNASAPGKVAQSGAGTTSGNQTTSQPTDVRTAAQIAQDKENLSQYNGLVKLSSVNKSTNPANEYIIIRVTGSQTKAIPVTGWTLKSTNSGQVVTIPTGDYLYFTGMTNAESNINLASGDTLYLITGISPIGESFKVNKCSGYLGQFQTFTPYINNKCPLAKNEDLSGIPKIATNDACLDYINTLPQCSTQTTTQLPVNWSYECKNFITTKLSYPSCVDTHKNDPDFYQHEWRVYLKRSASIWKTERENIVLYDNLGKVVDTFTY